MLGDVGDRVGVGGVAVEFGDQVDGERGDRDGRIVDHRPQAGAEEVTSVVASAPYVQRVGRGKPVVEQAVEDLQRIGG